MGEQCSRRRFLKYVAAGAGSFILPNYGPKESGDKNPYENPNYINASSKVTQAVLDKEGQPFIFLPNRNISSKAPGLASMPKDIFHMPERGGISRIYDILNDYPWVSLEVNGAPISIGSSPLVNLISRSLWTQEGNSGRWEPDPSLRQAFTLEPGWGSSLGNCFGFHNSFLKEYGVYEGVYRDTDSGKVYTGQTGFNRLGVHKIIGIVRYPLIPNSSDDRLVLYPSKCNVSRQMLGPDVTGKKVYFRCVEAGLLSAKEADKKGWWNKEGDFLYLLSCYPPEYSDLTPPPPGRLLMKLEQVN
ncbi:MAG: hypothetical protein PHX72_02595 [Candidatus Shapirobacteria bacterium]|nr:hypothetical protein [Candidatus Shapirobacteria bacterium]